MRFSIVELATLSDQAKAKLAQRLRETAQEDSAYIIPEANAPPAFDHLRIGCMYGAHHEVIARRELRTAGIPLWFDPRVHPGQFGIIARDGLRCYAEVNVDAAARNAPSTFEARLLPLAEDDPEQIALL